MNGAFSLAFAASWSNYLALDGAARREDDARARRASTGTRKLMGPLLGAATDGIPAARRRRAPRTTTTGSTTRRTTSTGQALDVDFTQIDTPGLHVGGWWDIFVRGTVNDYVTLAAEGRAPQKLVLGPWHHMPWRPLSGATGEVGAHVVDDWQLRYWREVLDGERDRRVRPPGHRHT